MSVRDVSMKTKLKVKKGLRGIANKTELWAREQCGMVPEALVTRANKCEFTSLYLHQEGLLHCKDNKITHGLLSRRHSAEFRGRGLESLGRVLLPMGVHA